MNTFTDMNTKEMETLAEKALWDDGKPLSSAREVGFNLAFEMDAPVANLMSDTFNQQLGESFLDELTERGLI